MLQLIMPWLQSGMEGYMHYVEALTLGLLERGGGVQMNLTPL